MWPPGAGTTPLRILLQELCEQARLRNLTQLRSMKSNAPVYDDVRRRHYDVAQRRSTSYDVVRYDVNVVRRRQTLYVVVRQSTS